MDTDDKRIAERQKAAEEAAAKAYAAEMAADVVKRKACAEPFPGPLHEAFAAEPPTVAGIKLRAMVAADFILLKQLGSPLYRRSFDLAEHQRRINAGEIAADAPPPSTSFTEEELAEMVYQLMQPARDARRVLAQGREHFREKAMAEVMDRILVTDIPHLVNAVVGIYLQAFSTAIGYREPEKSGETQVNFTAPPPHPATGSAGGSATSPGSAGNTASLSTK
jgi:hypothetical protein